MSTVSTVTSGAQVLPRTALDLYLRTVRLPVTLAARATGQQDNAQWPPALAFESVQATVEGTVGEWLRDPALVERSRLRQEKLAQLRKAGALEEIAEQEQAEAKQEYEERTEEARDAARAAEKRAAARKAQAEEKAAAQARQAEKQAAARKQAAEEAEAAREKQVDRAERSRTLAALDEESKALAAEAKAQDAQAAADDVEHAIETSKAVRKAT